MRGWAGLYRTSLVLGVRQLARGGHLREAAVRLAIPMDPSRYLELPWVLEALGDLRGIRVLDLASPKLLAVELARRGARVTSVDELESEIDAWRALAAGVAGLDLLAADGRALPFDDGVFDHAYSVSVLEHIAGEGDAQALGELARVVRVGGKVLVTLPCAERYREDWRDRPVYAEHEAVDGRYFFQRWYDARRVDLLAGEVPSLELVSREVVRMQPNWNAAYTRTFPWLLPLGPLYGLLGRERRGEDGDVLRVEFVRR